MSNNLPNQHILELAEKWRNGTCSQEELQELEEWYNQNQDALIEIPYSFARSEREHKERMLNAIRQKAGIHAGVMKMNARVRWSAAAAIIIAIAIGSYFILFKQSEKTSIAKVSNPIENDVSPGKEGALLKLANGKVVVLDNVHDGNITDVAVKNGNLVSYENTQSVKVEINTMTTPKGRQFSLVLADGTRVWLNAESSITFPTAFTGSDRRVSITGEAYFEVAHDEKKAFHVNVNRADIQVLGTHFNVNSYQDEEDIKTSLIEGRIKIITPLKNYFLEPGQQAKQDKEGRVKLVSDIDTEAITAWKEGNFQFNDNDIKTVMRQLARWYDIDVQYNGVINKHFNGTISKNVNLSAVLKMLEETGAVKFKTENKKLIIMP